MKTHRLTGAALFVCAAALAGAGPAPADTELVARLISFLGISATPSQMKAPDALTVGDIWIADAGRNARARLTSDGGYSWPVFDPGGERILALRGSEVLEIPLAGGPPRRLASAAGITKLIGFERARRNGPTATPCSMCARRRATRSPATCSNGPTCSSRKATNGRGTSASARARIAASRHCRRMLTESLTCVAREIRGAIRLIVVPARHPALTSAAGMAERSAAD